MNPPPPLHQFLDPKTIANVVDVGASDGRFSRALCQHLPGAHYTLIDPLEYPNKWEADNATWIHKALHDTAGETLCFTEAPDKFSSGCYGGAVSNRYVHTTTLTEVCWELDDVFLKLDTHGIEMQILGEHLPVLRQKVPLVQIEVYNFPISSTSVPFYDMTLFMASYGYRVVTLLDTLYRGDGCLWQMDFLFAHEEHALFNRGDFFQ